MSDDPTIRIWIHARWRLPDESLVVRTVRRDATGNPDDAVRVAAAVAMAEARLERDGAVFTEGRATLVELLATETG